MEEEAQSQTRCLSWGLALSPGPICSSTLKPWGQNPCLLPSWKQNTLPQGRGLTLSLKGSVCVTSEAALVYRSFPWLPWIPQGHSNT